MEDRDFFKMLLTMFFTLFLSLMLLLALMASCTSVKYVPVESVKTDSIYINKVEKRDVYVHDSIYIKEKGDTIYEYRYKFLFKDVLKVDTFFVERNDTIYNVVEVEKKLTKWQKAKQELGGFAFGGIAVLLIGIIFAMIKRK